jgi:hypothetical protein
MLNRGRTIGSLGIHLVIISTGLKLNLMKKQNYFTEEKAE